MSDPSNNEPPRSEAAGGADSIDTSRRVFEIPVNYLLRTTVYVLATDLTAARTAVETLKEDFFDEIISFDEDTLWLNSSERMKILDLEVIDLITMNAKPVPTDVYDPAEHPDWFPEVKR